MRSAQARMTKGRRSRYSVVRILVPQSRFMSAALQILFAGSGEFGLPTLDALRQRHEIVRVYTQPDRPAGRGKHLKATAVAEFAARRNLPLTKTDSLGSQTLAPADVLVVIAFGQKISQAVTKHPRLGAINLHASLLPKHRGAAPIHHALMNGERIVGNSVIRLARKMDAGAILGQSRLQVQDAETTGELHDRLAADGTGLVLRVLEELAAGTAIQREQDHAEAALAPKLARADAKLDFTRPAAQVAAKINALSPWPGCHVRLLEAAASREELALLRARFADGSADGTPGEITSAGHIACGDGSQLEVIELQPRGRRRMTLQAYRNGHPWREGMRLEPEQV